MASAKISPATQRIVIAYQREAASMAQLARTYLFGPLDIPDSYRRAQARRYQRESARYYKSARQLMGLETPTP